MREDTGNEAKEGDARAEEEEERRDASEKADRLGE